VRQVAVRIERDVRGDALVVDLGERRQVLRGSVEFAAFIAAAISITPS
jgi:hypothetical protein